MQQYFYNLTISVLLIKFELSLCTLQTLHGQIVPTNTNNIIDNDLNFFIQASNIYDIDIVVVEHIDAQE